MDLSIDSSSENCFFEVKGEKTSAHVKNIVKNFDWNKKQPSIRVSFYKKMI